MEPLVSLSGWAQAPDFYPNAKSIDYFAHTPPQNVTGEMECLIGWSLGGLVAIQSIAQGLLKPKMLVLLSSPFCPAENSHLAEFRSAFAANHTTMLEQFQALVTLGDRPSTRRQLALHPNQTHALAWLDFLCAFDASTYPLSSLPPTLLVYGGKDAIVPASDGERYAKMIPHSHAVVLPQSSHAPHLHDGSRVTHEIEAFYAKYC